MITKNRESVPYYRLIFSIVTLFFGPQTINGNSIPITINPTTTAVFEINSDQASLQRQPSGTAGGGVGGLIPVYDIDTYVPFRSDSHDEFSWQLLKSVLQEENSNNVIISPFSVKLVLALLSEAAGTNTKTQMELIATQTDIKSLSNIREFYRKTLNSFKKENQLHNTLNFRTKLFADSFIETQQKFTATLKHFYETEIENLNFKDAQSAAKAINTWASNMTNGRLNNLVNEQNLVNSVMLLANIIYFNGLWKRPFADSYQGAFLKTEENQTRVEYMEQTEYFYYRNSDKLKAKILRLPYKGKNSMFVLLPEAIDGIDELVKNLENDQLKSDQWMMEEVKVKVTLPKFHFDYNKSFKETLSQLGVHEIFTHNASLPGLTRGAEVAGKVRVSNIIQKAGIIVNEKGTEAYAATVVEIENKFGGSSIIEEFNVNHPFVFFIEEDSTGNILFAGKVHDPAYF